MTTMLEIPDSELRKIHSRLDVHKQAIENIARSMFSPYFDNSDMQEVIDMLEESQNPFEVKDGSGADS